MDIRSRLAAVSVEPYLKPGQRVQIIRGAFSQLEAIFVANDGQIDSAPALVRILVRPINDAPSASAMALETAEGTA